MKVLRNNNYKTKIRFAIDLIKPHLEQFVSVIDTFGLEILEVSTISWLNKLTAIKIKGKDKPTVDMRFFNGDLGSKEGLSIPVLQILESVSSSEQASFTDGYFLFGPSGNFRTNFMLIGIGKTKTIFDLAKLRYCIILSLESGIKSENAIHEDNDIVIMMDNFQRVEAAATQLGHDEVDNHCTYELYLTVAARALVLLIWLVREGITPKQWLRAQIGGDILEPAYNIRAYLRHTFSDLPKMSEFMTSCLDYIGLQLGFMIDSTETITSADYRGARPFIALDEIQLAKQMLNKQFRSYTQPKQPYIRSLSNHLIRKLLAIHSAAFVAAGTAIGIVDMQLDILHTCLVLPANASFGLGPTSLMMNPDKLLF